MGESAWALADVSEGDVYAAASGVAACSSLAPLSEAGREKGSGDSPRRAVGEATCGAGGGGEASGPATADSYDDEEEGGSVALLRVDEGSAWRAVAEARLLLALAMLVSRAGCDGRGGVVGMLRVAMVGELSDAKTRLHACFTNQTLPAELVRVREGRVS